DGIRDPLVTGVQTCALPISGELHFAGQNAVHLYLVRGPGNRERLCQLYNPTFARRVGRSERDSKDRGHGSDIDYLAAAGGDQGEIGRASYRERVEVWHGGGE